MSTIHGFEINELQHNKSPTRLAWGCVLPSWSMDSNCQCCSGVKHILLEVLSLKTYVNDALVVTRWGYNMSPWCVQPNHNVHKSVKASCWFVVFNGKKAWMEFLVVFATVWIARAIVSWLELSDRVKIICFYSCDKNEYALLTIGRLSMTRFDLEIGLFDSCSPIKN